MTLSPDQFKQLSMFEPARSLRYQSESADSDYYDSPGQMWDAKLADSKDPAKTGHVGVGSPAGAPSLYDRIKATGVRTPVMLDVDYHGPEKYQILNGNHRVAAAADISQNVPGREHEEVPVQWGHMDRYDEHAAMAELEHLYSPAPEERAHFPQWRA